ncbi:MAG: 3-dehydroquinate synthase [Clostridiaceae bacterium]|nr:3-dehydroquinate synthase [Clostridiaceae bacterium]
MFRVRVNTSSKAYDIEIETGLFKKLPQLFRSRYQGRRMALISDDRVFALYGEKFFRKLREQGFDAIAVTFPERQKNLRTLERIYNALADASFTRSDYVIALGGGVTGDMAGLAAATFLRGMGFILIPTTLLAMVDSSIGGKVAVDMDQGKNLIGAFYQPDAVYTDPGLLTTLDNRCFSDGMAELIKQSVIRDKDLFYFIETSENRSGLTGQLDEIIGESCRLKAAIVEQDERDTGLRQILNFGHTIGHAIEKVQNYQGLTHGEAVSVGMIFITRITERLGLTRPGTLQRLEGILKSFDLPVTMPPVDRTELAQAIRIDKKSRSGFITVAYLREIGECDLIGWSFEELEEHLFAQLEN